MSRPRAKVMPIAPSRINRAALSWGSSDPVGGSGGVGVWVGGGVAVGGRVGVPVTVGVGLGK